MERNKIKERYILISSTNFPAGGAGASYLNLFCRGIKENGYDIRVFLLKGFAFGNYTRNDSGKNISEDGIPYTYLGFTHRPDNSFLKITEEILSSLRLIFFLFTLVPDRKSIRLLVYSGDLQFNIPIHFIAWAFNIKIVKFVAEIIDKSQFSGSFFRKLKGYGYNFNLKYLNPLSDKLIVFSSYLNNMYSNMGYSKSNIIIQPNLTDFNYWKSENSDIKYVLGYSGAPYMKDGLNDLFLAIGILNKQNIDVSLLVIGDSTFGESLIPSLKTECERLGIRDKVFFTGLVESPEVKHHLSECEILTITRPATIQTSAGFPTKLGEYFASDKPILATNFGDMDKYFTDGIDIVLAQCGNPESIALKIKWMLQNPQELRTIRQTGYEKAKKLLDYNISINRILGLLGSA